VDRPLERLAGWLRSHPFAVDATLAAALAIGAVCLPSGNPRFTGPSAVLLGLLLSVPVAWRRRAPVGAAVVVVAAGLLELVLSSDFLPANASALVMVHALAAYGSRGAERAGLVAGLVGAVLATVRYYYLPSGSVGAVVPGIATIAVAVVAAWALGRLRRARMVQVAGLEERARLLELERDQEMRLAATAERARIARELHDVVAHSLSVVIAQADGGRYAGKEDPDAATGALDAIAATGRQALTDMRALLGVLREDGRQEYAPQPDVGAIPALVEDVRTSGLDVDLIVEGTPQPLPAGPQLAAYRIVQESLTNVLKHAGPAGRAWVRLHWRSDALELSILDDGRGAAASLVDGQGDGHGHGTGHGLQGMRERAHLHGGRLDAGPRPGGGFGVHAALPYRAAR
jgi:signal transduction histidine kinase